ncbi:MAG: insulinase family protein [Dysgonamonadaceae bacterium]|jgi:predicted Zn-dependent peptidase|nr:insulinase family protein [Dysgonamonadaceae bacterium]
MKKLVLFALLLLAFFTGCKEKAYETVSKTDSNGYNYEEVTNDPFKARIYTLKNGLKVYLSRNADEPRIQTVIAVRAGSKDEPRDNTGLAHYLEHMMFKGTDHFGTSDWEKEKPLLDSIVGLFETYKATQAPELRKSIYQQIDAVSQEASKYAISNEYDKIIGALGASGTNAFTSNDQTAYINEIPANEIEKFIKLEYDRFTNMQLRLFHTELETVYEEFNMYQDQGSSMMWTKIFEGLFAEHPYKVDVIGLPEHLKSPSMNSVMAFQKYFYVPNNMAILMNGDLDFEKTIQIVDKYFGQMLPNEELKHAEPVVEQPLTEAKTYTVATPDQERIAVAYRFGGAKSKDALYLDLIGSVLYNGKAGLIDLDLLQQQKVLQLAAGTESLKDYGAFVFMGTPRDGQTLEELGDLIQAEIKKLKAGDFDEGLLEAIINNKKLDIIQMTDGRDAAYEFLDAFINEIDWKDHVARIDELAKITKVELVAFANDFFADNNYVTVYKHTGENKDKVTVDKPHITPITINREVESAFAAELQTMVSEPIEPVFLDYEALIKKNTLKDGVDFYYTKNVTNKIYSLDQFVEIANITDKKLALAFRYLPYLGTSKYTPEQLKMEMYRLAMSFDTYSSSGRSYVSLFGLNETFDRSLTLMQEMLNDAVVNKEAYDNLVNDILKQRANAKLNKSAILSGGLLNYAKYGPKSAYTDILSEGELKAIDPQELIDIIKQFVAYRHGYFYYGPDSESKIAGILKNIKTPDVLNDVPARVEYPELSMEKPLVYFADYDMVQAEIILLAKDVVFDPSILPYQSMFNSYYGSGMNSIVFQEIREARGLAYSAYAYVTQPARAGFSCYVQAYVGTQVDKMTTAINAFRDMLGNMAKSEKSFALSKEYVLNNMRSERITKSNIFWNYMSLKDRGINYDIRKPAFEAIQTMTLDDIQKYFDEHIKPAKYSILIIGKKDKVDFNYLKSFAEVKEIPLEELFGY